MLYVNKSYLNIVLSHTFSKQLEPVNWISPPSCLEAEIQIPHYSTDIQSDGGILVTVMNDTRDCWHQVSWEKKGFLITALEVASSHNKEGLSLIIIMCFLTPHKTSSNITATGMERHVLLLA